MQGFGADERLGGFKGRTVLELGPLEGGHSYMLQHLGAPSVVAVEANTRAFMRCLCIKEIFGLDRVHLKLGDFLAYLGEDSERFGIVAACGALYHMLDPIRLLDLIAEKTDRLLLWTHYYDADPIAARTGLREKFGPLESFDSGTQLYQGATYSYRDAVDSMGFSGG